VKPFSPTSNVFFGGHEGHLLPCLLRDPQFLNSCGIMLSYWDLRAVGNKHNRTLKTVVAQLKKRTRR